MHKCVAYLHESEKCLTNQMIDDILIIVLLWFFLFLSKEDVIYIIIFFSLALLLLDLLSWREVKIFVSPALLFFQDRILHVDFSFYLPLNTFSLIFICLLLLLSILLCRSRLMRKIVVVVVAFVFFFLLYLFDRLFDLGGVN